MKTLTPNLYIGFGSAAYALVKTDGQLQHEASIKSRLVLVEQLHGHLAMQSFQLREHDQTPAEEAYQIALRYFSTHRRDLHIEVKNFFVKLLKNIARADDHISRKETAFINRFQRDLHKI